MTIKWKKRSGVAMEAVGFVLLFVMAGTSDMQSMNPAPVDGRELPLWGIFLIAAFGLYLLWRGGRLAGHM